MKRRLLGAMKIINLGSTRSKIIFWSILLFFLIFNMILAWSIQNYQTGFSFNIAIFIYLGITSFSFMKKSFHYCIHMGFTRKEFVFASILEIFFDCFIMVFISEMILIIAKFVTKTGHLDGFNLFSWSQAFTHTSSVITNIWIDMCFGILIATLSFLLATLFYKYGLAAPMILPLLIIIGVSLPIVRKHLTDFAIYIYQTQNILYFGWLLVLGILVSMISYLPLRNIDLKK